MRRRCVKARPAGARHCPAVSDGAFRYGVRWLTAGRLSAQVFSWVATIFVMRWLSPQDYGLAAICTAIVGAVTIVAEFALSAGLVQAKSLSREQLRSVFGAVLTIASACAAFVWLAAPALGHFFHAPESSPLIRVAALQLLLGPMAAIPDASLRRELRFRAMAALEFTHIFAASLLTLGLVLAGMGVWALVLGPLGGSVVRVLMLQVLAPARLWPSFRFAPARDLIRFGATVATSRVAAYVFGQSDIWIAGRMLQKSQLGEYSVAMQLAMLPLSKTMAILNDVLFPIIAKMNREGADIRAPLLGGLQLAMYVAVPVLWGLAVAADDLLPLLIGPHWNRAIPILQIVCLVLPVRMINIALSTVLQGSGRADLDLRNTLTGAVLLPPLFLLGVSQGALGLAFAWAAGLPLMVLINLIRSRHALRIAPLAIGRAALRPGYLGIALLAVGFGTQALLAGTSTRWLALLITVAASQAAYWGLLALLDRPALLRLLEFFGIASGKRLAEDA